MGKEVAETANGDSSLKFFNSKEELRQSNKVIILRGEKVM